MAKCFIITPYGKKLNHDGNEIDFEDIFNEVIEQAVDEAKLTPVRSDRQLESGPIFRQMIQDIASADVCLADITTHNANVFYELGVRHALRPGTTVLIRLEGQPPLPFDISALRVLGYGPIPERESGRSTEARDNAIKLARAKIAQAITSAQLQRESDSLVFYALPNLSVAVEKPIPIETIRRQSYLSKKRPDCQVGLIGGKLPEVRGVSVWVNSENTDMQMSRFYEMSISGTIRYHGAEKSPDGRVSKDLIADELADWMRTNNATSVIPGKVIRTGPGNLQEFGVKFVLHVAAVQGSLGEGYEPVRNLRECVRNVLRQAEDREVFANEKASVLLPLLGTGTGGGKVEEVAPRLFQEAFTYLDNTPASVIDSIWFLAYSEQHWASCLRAFDALVRENKLLPGAYEG
jgi:O-acetyl-ADP-ribose deacetylase (regulator of RNase III)